LHRKVGQRIIAASLIAVGFDDVIAKALEANKKAEAEGTAKVTQERLAADANVETTRGLKAKEDMITTVMKDRAATFAAKGGEQLAALERTREIASAIKGHSGTLVLGNSAIPTVPTGD
jgi:hypothetical protein